MAQKALIKKEMMLANTVRISQAPQDKYSEYYSFRRSELYRLDGVEGEIHKQSWLWLKMKKRG